jgi:hypothetical protein
MVTWQGNAPLPWPHRQRSSSVPADATACKQDLDSSDALRDTAAVIEQAEAALAPGEPRPEHDPVDRLHADQQVVEGILEEGLDGPRHQTLNEALISYAIPVLLLELGNGGIVSKAAQLGRPPRGSEEWLDSTKADREYFTWDMVADALPVFTRKVFVERCWSPRGGASLKTYFVNACRLQFAQLFRKWRNQRRTVLPVGLNLGPAFVDHAPDPATTVALIDDASRMLGEINDPQTRKYVVLRGAGFTVEQASRRAGLTPKAAESRLYRLRKSMKTGRHSDNRPIDNPASVTAEDADQSVPVTAPAKPVRQDQQLQVSTDTQAARPKTASRPAGTTMGDATPSTRERPDEDTGHRRLDRARHQGDAQPGACKEGS